MPSHMCFACVQLLVRSAAVCVLVQAQAARGAQPSDALFPGGDAHAPAVTRDGADEAVGPSQPAAMLVEQGSMAEGDSLSTC